MTDECISRRCALAFAAMGLTGCNGLATGTITLNPSPVPPPPPPPDLRGRVYFIEPRDGDLITSPFRVLLGIEGYSLCAANAVCPENSGHHHIIIDDEPVGPNNKIPWPGDERHIHYGSPNNLGGPITLSLPIGKHTLHAQLGDVGHFALGGDFTATIHIEVIPSPLG